jgi:hypothetical protein
MAKPLDTWKVFPHRPIETMSPNVWRIEGDLPGANGTRVMTVAKRTDGKLVVHNAIALDDPQMKELDEFGEVAVIVVPNGFHRLDAGIFAKRYPNAKVVCPEGAKKKVEQVVKVHTAYDDKSIGDDDVRFEHLEGTNRGEGVMLVRSADGETVVLNDAINNLPKMGGFFGFILAPTGRASVPRIARWMMIKDKPAFRAHVERLAKQSNLKRVIVSHGAVMSKDAGDTLASALTSL